MSDDWDIVGKDHDLCKKVEALTNELHDCRKLVATLEDEIVELKQSRDLIITSTQECRKQTDSFADKMASLEKSLEAMLAAAKDKDRDRDDLLPVDARLKHGITPEMDYERHAYSAIRRGDDFTGFIPNNKELMRKMSVMKHFPFLAYHHVDTIKKPKNGDDSKPNN